MNKWPWYGKVGLGLLALVISAQLVSWLRPKRALEIVRTVKVTRGDLAVTTTATGEVKPRNRVEVKPPIAGRIEEVLVEEGQTVFKGAVLAWMSSTERAVLLDAARSQGEEAIARWEQVYKPAPLVAPLDGTVIVRIGVSCVITMLALGRGARQSITEELSRLGSNLLSVRPGSIKLRGVALLGQTVMRELFGTENPIGELIKINRVDFFIIGVLPSFGASTWRDQDDVIVIPLQTAMHRVLGKEYADS